VSLNPNLNIDGIVDSLLDGVARLAEPMSRKIRQLIKRTSVVDKIKNIFKGKPKGKGGKPEGPVVSTEDKKKKDLDDKKRKKEKEEEDPPIGVETKKPKEIRRPKGKPRPRDPGESPKEKTKFHPSGIAKEQEENARQRGKKRPTFRQDNNRRSNLLGQPPKEGEIEDDFFGDDPDEHLASIRETNFWQQGFFQNDGFEIDIHVNRLRKQEEFLKYNDPLPFVSGNGSKFYGYSHDTGYIANMGAPSV
jgi:hypothetical protein